MTLATTSHPDAIAQLQKLLPGAKIVTDQAQIADQTRSSFPSTASRLPSYMVQPASRDELQALIVFANEADLNLTVVSSTGIHRNGGISSSSRNILVDLSPWREVDLIDRRNRVCRIEPGVTYPQLLSDLAEHGMTVPMPLAPRTGKSVLAAVMDRVPSTWPNKQWDASDPVGSTEFFFGEGQQFRTGAGGGPGTIAEQRRSGGAQKFSSGPSQSDFHRILQGAQGTMGILTWITIRCELLPSQQRAFLVDSSRLQELVPFVYAVQRGQLGEHSFILDRTALAILMADGSQDEFARISNDCSPFVCLQNIAGFERLPRERLDYHLADINKLANQAGLSLCERIGPVSAADLLSRVTEPGSVQDWRDKHLGSSLSIFFLTTLDRTSYFREQFKAEAARFGFAEADFGTYIQPIVQNHACHVEFIVPFDAGSQADVRRVMQLENSAVGELQDGGAFFSRPYGSAAELVWSKNPANYQLVRQVKQIFDPNRVLQRGRWNL